jgi:hypothetical protein
MAIHKENRRATQEYALGKAWSQFLVFAQLEMASRMQGIKIMMQELV